MKKILTYLLLGACACALTACDLKEDRAYDESPDSRLQKVLGEYRQALISAPNGWIFSINTGISGGYQLYMSFNDRERVVMLCDMDASHTLAPASSSTPSESSFQLKALQMPSLIFDTYNYLHFMADPQGTTSNGGVNGIGLKSDFEFDIHRFDSGVFTLRGTYNKCTAYLRRATPEEAAAAMKGMLKTVFDNLAAYNPTAKAPFVLIGDTSVALATTGRTTTFTWKDADGKDQSVSSGSWMELTGDELSPGNLVLFTQVDVLGKKIVRLVWNGEAYDAVDAQGQVYTGANTPAA